MHKSIAQLSALLLGTLLLAFFVHCYIIENLSAYPKDQNLGSYYVMNGVVSLSIGSIIIYISEKKSTYLGFVFMAGSLLKFLFYFILYYGQLVDDLTERKAQVLSFYVPYGLSLIVEVWYLIRHLNKSL